MNSDERVAIRRATEADFESMFEIFTVVVAAGDTYVFAADTSRDEVFPYWFGPGMTSYVSAVDGRIVGMYKIQPNHRDRGSHVANASFMVDPLYSGRGIGRRMALHCLREAKRAGFAAMQFNLVVSTNAAAIALWQGLGFAVVGTLPQVFRHLQFGLVDAYVMHRSLEDIEGVTASSEAPIFGARVEGYPYVVRPSAYALVTNATGRIAVVRTAEGLFLPGGGIDAGESPEDAVVREVREECGLNVRPISVVGRAVQVALSSKKATCFEKSSTFFEAEPAGSIDRQPEHEVLWVSRHEAAAALTHESHAWAVQRLIERVPGSRIPDGQ